SAFQRSRARMAWPGGIAAVPCPAVRPPVPWAVTATPGRGRRVPPGRVPRLAGRAPHAPEPRPALACRRGGIPAGVWRDPVVDVTWGTLPRGRGVLYRASWNSPLSPPCHGGTFAILSGCGRSCMRRGGLLGGRGGPVSRSEPWWPGVAPVTAGAARRPIGRGLWALDQ